ncbi:MAG: class I SAM-dependent methyltransferase [Candidatus Marinimicrobia bacterium]|nr:class I SAM-dependent methyltransferase [Candidatus Neomarinimicrobiota bacterium]MCF7828296.1 class I SAM-dependent methyltransferase [Candidatus Neomarinimicrobiota bacterium]MCF7879529.1 class I SAM-dependent methyltransferase [Candidatus Neomarinimicrobiota bacterium]
MNLLEGKGFIKTISFLLTGLLAVTLLLYIVPDNLVAQGELEPVIKVLDERDKDVPYVPTPEEIVDKMLTIADVGPGDYVIDLGSGDGRIVIAAAGKDAVGHGVDIDEELVIESRRNAKKAGVDDRVVFLKENIFTTDISKASVITMYLLSSVNKRLRPRLLDELKPGTRVVSHSFDMDEWKPDKTFDVQDDDGNSHYIYYWITPADAVGAWNWTVNGDDFAAAISQEFQEITVELARGSSEAGVTNAVLRGKRISFMADFGETKHVYSGEIENDQITGTVQVRSGDEHTVKSWHATTK